MTMGDKAGSALDGRGRAALDAVAAMTGRSSTQEAIHAIERHVAAPPVVRMEVPPLPTVEVVKPAEQPDPPPKKRGRPRKPKPA